MTAVPGETVTPTGEQISNILINVTFLNSHAMPGGIVVPTGEWVTPSGTSTVSMTVSLRETAEGVLTAG